MLESASVDILVAPAGIEPASRAYEAHALTTVLQRPNWLPWGDSNSRRWA